MDRHKVWVVSDRRHDYSAAEPYGDLHPVFTGTVSFYNIDAIIKQITERLAVADRNDFVLTSGHAILNSLVSQYFMERFGMVTYLVWVSAVSEYRPLQIFPFGVERE